MSRAFLCLLMTAFALTAQPPPRCESERQLLASRMAAQSLELTKMPGPCSLRADFDGDGKADVALLVRLKAGAPYDNPWSRSTGQGSKGALAIAVMTESRIALLSHPDFFSSPIWESLQESLVQLVPRGKGPKAAKGAALGLATEGGDDVWIYWTGMAWRAAYPQSSSNGL